MIGVIANQIYVLDLGDILIASCAQDYYIRIWRISSRDPDLVKRSEISISDLDPEADIKMKEDTFCIEYSGKDKIL